ncbi:mannosyltransferase [Halobacillus andaensis]|uniref:Mannosyltransferase n=1 Tax=Halobacillus andaensis TaxID=1176239 RepID=A0A917B5N8_HALAA|nr:glycosyltransferase family 4 protein [Halobacillus andaensis]MBP2005810.1 glycosyltransferase involved in cell wall biosynthesis [Halobacillus andaensis]GGF25886.1 mannosyltransferase [Halobacillus andaensis]
MNVLLLTDKLIMGGAEIYFCKLENYLSHNEAAFFAAAGQGELEQQIKNKDRFLPLSRRDHIKNLRDLRKMILKNDIHVIHANSLRMVLYAISLQSMMKGHRFHIIYTKHNVTRLEQRNKILFNSLLNKHVDRILTVSEFEKNNLEKLGVEEAKVRTVYNGVDLNQFVYSTKKRTSTFNVGILARLSEEKNHDLFMDIANHFRNDSHFQFHMAGDGPEKERIRNRILSEGLNNVNMMGGVSKPETFIKEMDVLLLTSKREIFPMVILEAMASGTPIIAIDRGGISEAVIDRSTGFLIKQHDVVEYSQRIKELEENDLLREQICWNARKSAEKNFSLESMVEETLEEYFNCYGIERRRTKIEA